MKTLLYIGNKLSKHGLTPTTMERLGPFFEQEGYTMRYASDLKNPLLRLLDMGYTVFKSRKAVDFVLIDTYSTFGFWYALLVSRWCRLFKLRYIPLLHGGNLPERLDRSRWFSRLLFDHAFCNVAPSRYLVEAFEQRGFQKLVFIPNPIATAEYAFFSERDLQTPRLLWVRSFASIYNPKMAVDVLKRVQVDYPAATLCMIGPDKDGSGAATREYAAQQHVKVTFTGRLSKAQWTQRSKNYNVFINTTDFDNAPVSVLEALALGLPVVTTNVGGIPFLLQDRHTALLVGKNDAAAMARGIVELIRTPGLRSRLSENGRGLVAQFDWGVVREKWGDLFRL